jgi:protein gp37
MTISRATIDADSVNSRAISGLTAEEAGSLENSAAAKRPTAGARKWETWNPVSGCVKLSGGCRFCYAERISQHYGTTTLPWNQANIPANVKLHPSRLTIPLHWREPREVFAGSMTDLFGDFVPEAYLAQIFAVMALSQRHRFMIITKRAERLRDSLNDPDFWAQVSGSAEEFLTQQPKLVRPNDHDLAKILSDHILPNLTLAVTIESDLFVGRADALRATPAARRMIAAEPLLRPLTSLDLTGIDLLSVGGESGGSTERRLVQPCPEAVHRHNPRAYDSLCQGTGWMPKPEALAWVQALRRRARAAGVEFSLHQWGGPSASAGGNYLPE